MASSSRERYLAFMLRLWLTEGNGPAHWRASLQSVPGGELCGFDDIDALMGYLFQRTRSVAADDNSQIGQKRDQQQRGGETEQ